MRRSTYCIQAEKNAKPDDHDSVQECLIRLLKRHIKSGEIKKLQTRAGELINLFSDKSLGNKEIIALIRRLTDPKDYLGRLFKCELETSFREQLIEILINTPIRDPVIKKPPSEPTPEPAPIPTPVPTPVPAPKPIPVPPPIPIPEPIIIPPPMPPIIVDIRKYLKDLDRWIKEQKKRTNDSNILKKLDRLATIVKETIKLLHTRIVAPVIIYYSFNLLECKLYILLDAAKRLSLDHYLVRRQIGRFIRSPDFSKLQANLCEIAQLANEIPRLLPTGSTEPVSENKPQPEEPGKKEKGKRCYGKSQILGRPEKKYPTPEDLRIRACRVRGKAGTTFNNFKKKNVAVAKVIIKGSNVTEYVTAVSDVGIHSEDFIYIEIDRKFGMKNVKLDKLFSERIPCRFNRCKEKLAQAPKTKSFEAYFIVTKKGKYYRVTTLMEAYAGGT